MNVDRGPATFTLGIVQVFPATTEAVQIPEFPGVDPNDLAALLQLEDCDGNSIVRMFDRSWQEWILANLGRHVELTLFPSCEFQFPFLFRLNPKRREMMRELLEGGV